MELTALQSGATGPDTVHAPLSNSEVGDNEEALDDDGEDDEEEVLFADADAELSQNAVWLPPPPDIQLETCQLIDIAKSITSPNPDVQMAAVHEALSLIDRMQTDTSSGSPQVMSHAVSPENPLFRGLSSESGSTPYSNTSSFRPRPPSSQTTPMSSVNISKGRLSARATAAAAPILLPTARTAATTRSGASSKRRVTHAESNMASAVALNALRGMLGQVSDCMKDILDKLSGPALAHLAQPQFPASSSQNSAIHRSMAMDNLNIDNDLDPKVFVALALEFSSNEGLCAVYGKLQEPHARKKVARTWYNLKHPNSPIHSPVLPASNVRESDSPAGMNDPMFSFHPDSSAPASPCYPNGGITQSYLSAADNSSSYLFADGDPKSFAMDSGYIAGNMPVNVHGDQTMDNMDYTLHHDNSFYDGSLQ